jgi:hypothetical protein
MGVKGEKNEKLLRVETRAALAAARSAGGRPMAARMAARGVSRLGARARLAGARPARAPAPAAQASWAPAPATGAAGAAAAARRVEADAARAALRRAAAARLATLGSVSADALRAMRMLYAAGEDEDGT